MTARNIDIVVLSDIHLGTYGAHAEELHHYLSSIHPKMIILNGDIFDIWQFNKSYFPASHFNVIQILMDKLNTGCRIIYLTGNHDE
ncbi:MAG: metallophosphoesterase, partial [Saprospiraceae bacterium]|nr:metallophosphoesterase [Saprospiraceae bacterium]